MNKEHYNHLVQEAIKHYDIQAENIEYFIEETNIFYKIDAKQGIYMLKIFQEDSSKIEDNLAEVYFINEIATKTDIIVPKVISTKDNESILQLENNNFPDKKRIALYEYIDGVDFNGNETRELFQKLGEATAKLHIASKELVIPNNINPKKWDKVFYYRGEEAIYNTNKYHKFITKDDRLLLDKFIPYLNNKLQSYYTRESFIIHADLNPWNVRIHKNEIRLLDFEEAMYASEIHDLAILLFYYRYDPNYNYQEVKEDVFKGYQKQRELPIITEFDIDLLIMARTTNFINYVLILYDDPTEYIKNRMKRIREFITEYKINL